jgi:hypothetical protein
MLKLFDNAFIILSNCSEESKLGVPPPKNIVSTIKSGYLDADILISINKASTNLSIRLRLVVK